MTGTSAGEIVRAFRVLERLNQKQLAERLACSQTTISLIEKGHRQVPASLLAPLAEALGFEPDLIDRPDGLTSRVNLNFRDLKRTPAWAREQAEVHVRLLRQLVGLIASFVKLPASRLPSLTGSSPREAAEECRTLLKLGLDRPIASMVRVLENSGVIVAKFSELDPGIDAFSCSTDKPAIVVLSNARAAESPTRRRMSLAHELGHLLLHATDTNLEHDEREREADAFAGEFLLPRDAFHRVFPQSSRSLAWDKLFDMKERWKVSVAAIVYRAHELELIREATYQYAWRIMRSRWHPVEPREPEHEEPEVLPTALNLVTTKREHGAIARALGWGPKVFERITGLAVPEPPVADAALPANVIRLRQD